MVRSGTPSWWGIVGITGGTVATTGCWKFALPRRAGFRYKVEVPYLRMVNSMGARVSCTELLEPEVRMGTLPPDALKVL